MTSVQEHVSNLRGADVYDRDGDKIGTVGQLFTDESGQPTWASVNTGLFGLRESLVPVHEARWHDNRLQVPYEKATVKDAPNVDTDADEPLDTEGMSRLYRHYNLPWDDATSGTASGYTERSGAAAAHGSTGTTGTAGYAGSTGTTGTAGYAGSTGTTGTAGYAGGTGSEGMTRSEEQLRVGTERERVGQARLRKYVVTENVETTVPVQRQEVRVEREPITEANRDSAYSGPELTESEHEVTLHAERPVVSTETVPVERVRMGTETVTEEQTVGGQVRKEQIEADLPGEEGTRRIG